MCEHEQVSMIDTFVDVDRIFQEYFSPCKTNFDDMEKYSAMWVWMKCKMDDSMQKKLDENFQM